jgi:hypothetical protein
MKTLRCCQALIATVSLLSPRLFAQATPTPPTSAKNDDVVQLSAFTVEAGEDRG